MASHGPARAAVTASPRGAMRTIAVMATTATAMTVAAMAMPVLKPTPVHARTEGVTAMGAARRKAAVMARVAVLVPRVPPAARIAVRADRAISRTTAARPSATDRWPGSDRRHGQAAVAPARSGT